MRRNTFPSSAHLTFVALSACPEKGSCVGRREWGRVKRLFEVIYKSVVREVLTEIGNISYPEDIYIYIYILYI